MVDVATLTGACVIALGSQAHGLYSNHPPLADALEEVALMLVDELRRSGVDVREKGAPAGRVVNA